MIDLSPDEQAWQERFRLEDALRRAAVVGSSETYLRLADEARKRLRREYLDGKISQDVYRAAQREFDVRLKHERHVLSMVRLYEPGPLRATPRPIVHPPSPAAPPQFGQGHVRP